jgi:hypothetical protein
MVSKGGKMKKIIIDWSDKEKAPKITVVGVWIRRELDIVYTLTLKEVQNYNNKMREREEVKKPTEPTKETK